MTNQKQIDYERIEKAIHFINDHFKQQPSLEDIAEAVHVSPFHFQKMFSEWAGVSPKKFMQYISLSYAKDLLKKRMTVLDTAYETGLSGPSRLHDLFVTIEGMTPGEFKNGGADLTINYCFAESPFGKIIVASTHKGVCHMALAEEGYDIPGTVLIGTDSHTCTSGAFGMFSTGVGNTDAAFILGTGKIWEKVPQSMKFIFNGEMPSYLTAKDMILAIIRRIGTAGGTGYAIEFGGEAVRALSMEGRMTICNMAIEAGARSGMVAVDDTTIAYIKNRPYAPKGELWQQAVTAWRDLHSDSDAVFDHIVSLNAAEIRPQVSWGTSPEMVTDVDGSVPDPNQEADPIKREGMQRALEYMGLAAGIPITQIQLDRVFIGSCTNARIEDLRAAATVVQGRKVAASIKQAMVVPGSGLVKQQAEAEGLDQIFQEAGFEWREPGCSMCLAMNADRLGAGEHCASTSNRNFEGRQGQGGRTHLVSPSMAAAAAIAGHFVDIRALAR